MSNCARIEGRRPSSSSLGGSTGGSDSPRVVVGTGLLAGPASAVGATYIRVEPGTGAPLVCVEGHSSWGGIGPDPCDRIKGALDGPRVVIDGTVIR
jgi:hypothetical protein